MSGGGGSSMTSCGIVYCLFAESNILTWRLNWWHVRTRVIERYGTHQVLLSYVTCTIRSDMSRPNALHGVPIKLKRAVRPVSFSWSEPSLYPVRNKEIFKLDANNTHLDSLIHCDYKCPEAAGKTLVQQHEERVPRQCPGLLCTWQTGEMISNEPSFG